MSALSALLKTNLNAFMLAIGFLTRIPTPHIEQGYEEASQQSILYYPFAGIIIGGIVSLPILLLPTDHSLILAVSSVLLWVVITGGLHLDGLADSADAWLGSQGNKERALTIMKDPAAGPAGVLALVMILLIKVAAITAILDAPLSSADTALTLLFSIVIARALILLLFLITPYVRDKGLATSLISLSFYPSWIIVCVTIAVIFAMGYFMPVLFTLLIFSALRWLKMKVIAGFTGDTAGAVIEICEAVFIFVVAVQVT